MKNQAKWALSLCNRLVLQRRLSELTVGEGSTVYLWRVSGGRGSRIVVGNGSRVETRLTLERAGATLAVGDRSFIGEGQISCANRVEIGNDVMVAWGTAIFDHASHSLRFTERANDVGNWIQGVKDWDNVNTQAVRIADKAWIGFGCIVLPGVSIGEGAVIGAGAVVTRDVPSWTVSAGNPARVIRELAPDER